MQGELTVAAIRVAIANAERQILDAINNFQRETGFHPIVSIDERMTMGDGSRIYTVSVTAELKL